MRGCSPTKPSPSGGRWLAEGQTDEGATIERFRSSQGDFAACGRRVSFWMPRKKPKRHQGAAQDERFALIFAAPGPHFTGAQLGSLAVNAKARVAQLNGCPSIAAAAEWSVTFGGCSYRWKARLLSDLGSSAAQGTGGRVRTPAPTEYPEMRLSLRRGRSQTGPGVPVGGHMGPPLRFERTALIIGPFPSSASLCSAPSPRGRLAGAHCAPLRRKTGWERWFGSGRRRNKTAPVPIFFPLRPPVGPDGMAPKHSWYCAPEGPHNVQGVTPVMGSGGKANMSAPRSS